MSAPIVTGAQIFRAKKTIIAAEIFALHTTPVLLVPAVPGKSLKVLGWLETYNFGTVAYTFKTGAVATAFYGPLNSGAGIIDIPAEIDLVTQLVSGETQSQDFGNQIAAVDNVAVDLVKVKGLGIYLVETVAGFASGSAAAATVDAAHKGLLYALNDTGTIQVTGDTTDPTYTVTGVGAGGLVTTVTVAGGSGIYVGGSFATTVVTGSGDGTLKLSISAITELGDGTLEIDVLYTPI